MNRLDVQMRYEQDSRGRVLIDVAADGIEDLYRNFDHHASYIRRDLDPELVEYEQALVS